MVFNVSFPLFLSDLFLLDTLLCFLAAAARLTLPSLLANNVLAALVPVARAQMAVAQEQFTTIALIVAHQVAAACLEAVLP